MTCMTTQLWKFSHIFTCDEIKFEGKIVGDQEAFTLVWYGTNLSRISALFMVEPKWFGNPEIYKDYQYQHKLKFAWMIVNTVSSFKFLNWLLRGKKTEKCLNKNPIKESWWIICKFTQVVAPILVILLNVVLLIQLYKLGTWHGTISTWTIFFLIHQRLLKKFTDP